MLPVAVSSCHDLYPAKLAAKSRNRTRTLAGYEAMAMIKKGQVRNINGRDIKAQASFIASLFEVAA